MFTHEHIHTNTKIILASKNFSINEHVPYVLTKYKSTYKLKTSVESWWEPKSGHTEQLSHTRMHITQGIHGVRQTSWTRQVKVLPHGQRNGENPSVYSELPSWRSPDSHPILHSGTVSPHCLSMAPITRSYSTPQNGADKEVALCRQILRLGPGRGWPGVRAGLFQLGGLTS